MVRRWIALPVVAAAAMRLAATAHAACTLTCPANITTSAAAGQCGAEVNYPAPTTAGTCGDLTLASGLESGSFFPTGVTTVSFSASVGVSCSFTVTVNDTQPPSITCPTNLSVPATSSAGAVVDYSPATAEDNCPGVATPSCTEPSGSLLPVGATTVTCTVADVAGNQSACSFLVSVTPPAADLTISQTVAPEEALVGDNLSYTVLVTNNGPAIASGVEMTDSLPAEVSLIAATPSQGDFSQNGKTLQFNLGGLAVGAIASVTIVVKAESPGTISNTASVSATEPDPNAANNVSTLGVTVSEPPPPASSGCGAGVGSSAVGAALLMLAVAGRRRFAAQSNGAR
jgi:uncharacterized repeat protein (TIGR01451 family)